MISFERGLPAGVGKGFGGIAQTTISGLGALNVNIAWCGVFGSENVFSAGTAGSLSTLQ